MPRPSVAVPDDAWLLVDGSSPRASRWAVALAALFAGFALWNLAGVARVLARVRDCSGDEPEAPVDEDPLDEGPLNEGKSAHRA